MIAVAYLGAMALATAVVPWKIDLRGASYATQVTKGYSVIWEKPAPVATIDYGKILLEYVAMSCVFGIAYIALVRKQ